MVGRIIYLSPEDDAASIRDRLEWANADRVVLVVDRSARSSKQRPIQTELDAIRIKRAADQLGTEVALVSPSLRQRMLARQVGLIAFSRIDEALARHWLTPPDIQPLQRLTPPRRFQPRSLHRFFPRRNWLSIGLRTLIGLSALAVLVTAGLALVPTARITLTASSQSLSTIVPVTLDVQATRPDAAQRIVPAQRIDAVVEGNITTPATGAKDIPRFRANGTVTFFNALGAPYTVPRNTVVRTSSSSVAVRFATLAPIEVPAGGRASVPIQAIEPGPSGNVPANQINRVEGMPALAVRVTNPEPTQGGGNQTVRSVTEADYRRARSALRTRLLSEALDKLRQDPDVVSNGWYVVPDTLFIAEVQDETYDRFITEPADEVTMNMRLQVGGLAVSPGDLFEVAREALERKVPPGYALLSARAERGDVAEEGTGPNTVFYLVAEGVAGAEIDENAVKTAVRGLTPGEAQSTLLQRLSLRGNPQIALEPEWFARWINRLPLISLRIDTQVRRE